MGWLPSCFGGVRLASVCSDGGNWSKQQDINQSVELLVCCKGAKVTERCYVYRVRKEMRGGILARARVPLSWFPEIPGGKAEDLSPGRACNGERRSVKQIVVRFAHGLEGRPIQNHTPGPSGTVRGLAGRRGCNANGTRGRSRCTIRTRRVRRFECHNQGTHGTHVLRSLSGPLAPIPSKL